MHSAMRVVLLLACTDVVLTGCASEPPSGPSAVTAASSKAPSYVATILPTLGGSQSFIYDINSAGVIVGQSQTGTGEFHAVRWDNGVLTDLSPEAIDHVTATAVNSAGQIVGWMRTEEGSIAGLLWENGATTTLGSTIFPTDINSQGIIVGTGGDYGHAVVWNPSTASAIDLGWCLDRTDRSSAAQAINSSGLIVGLCEDDLGFAQAILAFSDHTVNLGTFPRGRYARAAAINASGEVVGSSESEVDGVVHAFHWKNGHMSRLERPRSLRSDAYAISDNGEIVGDVEVSPGVNHATLWVGRHTVDLDPGLGGEFFSSGVTAITASGDKIVGWSSTLALEQVPILWTRQ